MNRTQDQLTYRAPRTQQEAFGPYTSRDLYSPPEPMPRSDKIVLWGCTLSLVSLLVMGLLGWLK